MVRVCLDVESSVTVGGVTIEFEPFARLRDLTREYPGLVGVARRAPSPSAGIDPEVVETSWDLMDMMIARIREVDGVEDRNRKEIVWSELNPVQRERLLTQVFAQVPKLQERLIGALMGGAAPSEDELLEPEQPRGK